MDAGTALDRVVAALPHGGEAREGQRTMTTAVELAIGRRRHLVVQAGTGTGKTLAYLVPAVLSGKKVVVATATKALQDQLAGKDLPALGRHLGVPVTFAVLKGRSNYLCLQRAKEVLGDSQLSLDGIDGHVTASDREEIVRLVKWGTETASGDRAELPFEPSPRAWGAVSVTARECPGAANCPVGEACFTERARRAAADVDVVVVNTHLYGVHLASGGTVLPEHDIVIVDEAHQLEDIISATSGLELTGKRFHHLARAVQAIVAADDLIRTIDEAGDLFNAGLAAHLGERLKSAGTTFGDLIALTRTRLDRTLAALRPLSDDGPGDTGARKQRAVKLASELVDDLNAIAAVPESHVAWVEGTPSAPVLRVAPIDVGGVLDALLWSTPDMTAVLTSATIPPAMPARLGMPAATDELDVGSPFDYEANSLLYCAAHLPDPRQPAYEPAMHDELGALMDAAGGRTLALFTSYRAMTAAVEALRGRTELPILMQGDKPKAALLEEFTRDEATCLFATMGFWQGVDVVGRSLSLVTIDKLPFPRPDEPLLQARRERARQAAFATIDLPRAATLLAQGAGRLIRSANDRGVVAVFDPRLASAKNYRWTIIKSLPPMRRSKDRAEAESFLREIAKSNR